MLHRGIVHCFARNTARRLVERSNNGTAAVAGGVSHGGITLDEIRQKDEAYFDGKARTAENRRLRADMAADGSRNLVSSVFVDPTHNNVDQHFLNREYSGNAVVNSRHSTVASFDSARITRDDPALVSEDAQQNRRRHSHIGNNMKVRLNDKDVKSEIQNSTEFKNLATGSRQSKRSIGKSREKSPTKFEDENLPLNPNKYDGFRVRRTVSGNLPVYERFKRGGVEAYTVLRQVDGNQGLLRKLLMRICEAPCRVRAGAFEVRGLHTWKLKEWLTSLGH